jgi:acyl-CoA thioester hydrolase
MAQPLTCPQKKVEPEWIDYNGHMNMAYYSLVFDKCLDHTLDGLGVGAEYTQTQGGSCFAMEIHLHYLSELSENDPIDVTFQLLDWDAKRLHFFQEMRHGTEGYVAATLEQLTLHVDMSTRRAAPFPEAVQEKLSTLMSEHAQLAMPQQIGHVIGIKRKPA